MAASKHIRYLRRRDIDDTRWDECIRSFPNGLIYGRTFFLDKLTDGQWDALVLGDYQAIMPLTWRKKFGFTYLYQPFFIPELGIFGPDPQHLPIYDFLAAIPSRFRLWDFHLNDTNSINPQKTGMSLKIIRRINYLLPLDRPYAVIHEGYSRLAGRMLKKAAELSVVHDIAPSGIIGHYKHNYRIAHPEIQEEDYRRLKDCAELAAANGQATAWIARSPDGEVQAFYLVFADERCVYSTLGGATEKGKGLGAFYLLTDAVIQAHAGKEKTFRFEGSDIQGIAFFNSQFGPTPVHYSHIVRNRLPFPINLFKRP